MSYKECKQYAKDCQLKYNTLTEEFWIYADEAETPLIIHKISELPKDKKEKLKNYLIDNGLDLHHKE